MEEFSREGVKFLDRLSQASAGILPGESRLIAVATKQYPRFSEADSIELSDGQLLLAVGRKEGAGDFARGTIVGMRSKDQGRSWDNEPHVIQAPWDDVTDVMSVSLVRTGRGIHLFFLARGPEAKRDTRVYYILSTDEGKTWGPPQRVTRRDGYHVVNNARVVRLKSGRLIVPAAFVPGSIEEFYNQQRVYCLYSDDDGMLWHETADLALDNVALMEPGVAECADGSIYMTIRTATGHLYEARSHDDGATWRELKATALQSPAAPSTVVRDPGSQDLWMFWCNRPAGAWRQRTPQAFARSTDHGRTWSPPRNIESDPDHGYGYISCRVVADEALLTYYDWSNQGQGDFQLTSLRQRIIPLSWLRGGSAAATTTGR